MVTEAFLAALALSMAAPVAAGELEGVKLDDRIVSAGQPLQLNGMALRKRVFFRVYVAGLYLTEKAQDPQRALTLPGPKRMALVMLRNVGADQFAESLLAGLRDNTTEDEFVRLKPQTDQLLAAMRDIGEAKNGTAIDLDYVPNSGSIIRVNGKAAGAPIPGEGFYRALLRIWIGERPVSDDMKKALLGG